MRHDVAWRRLPDILARREGQPELRRHIASCHACQRQLFLLQRVDALLRSHHPASTGATRQPSRVGRMIGLAGGVGAVAVLLALVLVVPRTASVRPLRFHPVAAPEAVVRGSVSPGNAVLTIVARGLPREPGDEGFLVWASDAVRGEPVVVGRFMAAPGGECRARFNLPAKRGWARFWITPESSPELVVAESVA